MVRCRLSSVSGFPFRCLNIRIPYRYSRLAPPPTGRADFPHPAVPSTFSSGHSRVVFCSELNDLQSLMKKVVPTHAFRWLQGALTSTLEVLGEALLHETIDITVRLTGIAVAKVVRPTDQEPVQSRYHQADRQPAHSRCRKITYPLAGFGQRFRRGKAIQILPALPFQVVIVSEGVAQKVQTLAFFIDVDHARLVLIDFQGKTLFQHRLDPLPDAGTDVSRHHDEVIGVPYQPGFSPLPWPCGSMKRQVKPVKKRIRQQRGDHPANNVANWPR
jgi:hypothetical protein